MPSSFYIVTRATTTNIQVVVGEGETEYVELELIILFKST